MRISVKHFAYVVGVLFALEIGSVAIRVTAGSSKIPCRIRLYFAFSC